MRAYGIKKYKILKYFVRFSPVTMPLELPSRYLNVNHRFKEKDVVIKRSKVERPYSVLKCSLVFLNI